MFYQIFSFAIMQLHHPPDKIKFKEGSKAPKYVYWTERKSVDGPHHFWTNQPNLKSDEQKIFTSSSSARLHELLYIREWIHHPNTRNFRQI